MQLYNLTTDPLPPVQPKEVGFQVVSLADYKFLSSGEQQSFAYVVGYQFSSYSRLTIQTQGGGTNEGLPLMTISYDNYTNPADQCATTYIQYDKQTCTYGPTEGFAAYPGYDQYTNELMGYYEAGVPIYYSTEDYQDFGPTYTYEVLVPWDYQPPRELTYTLIYQQSTGYLLAYILNGTEYCCKAGGCVTEGYTCTDGTTAALTWANSSTYYSNYQLFNKTSYPDGFFTSACPFESEGNGTTSCLGSTNELYTSSSQTCTYTASTTAIIAILTAILTSLAAILIGWVVLRSLPRKQVQWLLSGSSSSGEQEEAIQKLTHNSSSSSSSSTTNATEKIPAV